MGKSPPPLAGKRPPAKGKGRLAELLGSPIFHGLLVVYLGAFAYSNTFGSPLIWDESLYIMENPIIKDLSYFIEPSAARGFEQYDIFVNRYVGFLTFALNYRAHGLAVEGYHIVNLALHLANALLVYLFVALTFRTPNMAGSVMHGDSRYIALFSALVFVAHPAQAEAVTYIFQRLTSLCTFFYLLSLVLYIRHRLSGGGAASWALYALSLSSALLAMKTKEIAFTLPLAVALYDALFLRGPFRGRALRLVPLLLTMCVIPLTIMGKSADRSLATAAEAAGGIVNLSALDYLFTEFRVLLTYLRLLALPVNQNFDYDYPAYYTFFTPQVLGSFMALVLLLSSGVWALLRSRRGEPALRLAAFGVFWFFLTLSVESTLIRIPMLINEYRLYLPSSVALAGAVSAAFIVGGRNLQTRKAMFCALIALPLVLAAATFARNSLWRTEAALWEDAAAKSPNKIRPRNNLCNSYVLEGEPDMAIKECERALSMEAYNTMSLLNLGMAYLQKEDWDEAARRLDVVLLLEPENAAAHLYAGIAYGRSGRPEKGIEHLETARRLKPHTFDADAQALLGDLYNAAAN